MSEQAVQAFRDLVNDNAQLRVEFSEAYLHGPSTLTAMAKRLGFEATEEQVLVAVESVRAKGELTDAELELVSGGNVPCQSSMPGKEEYVREGQA